MVILLLISIILYSKSNNEFIVIPEDSIRFRVIPNSNSIEDIYIKNEVMNSVQNEIHMLGNFNNINDSRVSIQNNLINIESAVSEKLNKNKYDKSFSVNYGLNYFPKKEYKGVIYNEGYYESLVIKIGKGEGNNFWCVMFPPLCFLEAEKSEKIEYKFFVKEIIDKILKNN
jgi:stage II sporulation protein R